MIASHGYAFATVPAAWRGDTIVCIGSGPSLTRDDVDLIAWAISERDDLHVVVVNDAYRLAPWADVIVAADAIWWQWQAETNVPDHRFPLIRYTLQPKAQQYRRNLQLLNYRSGNGVSDDPSLVYTGGHTGFVAINVARHLLGAGGGQIVLLGYDMMPAAVDANATPRQHFFGNHPDDSHLNYEAKLEAYADLALHLESRRIEIVNCSRETAIPSASIPRHTLRDVL